MILFVTFGKVRNSLVSDTYVFNPHFSGLLALFSMTMGDTHGLSYRVNQVVIHRPEAGTRQKVNNHKTYTKQMHGVLDSSLASAVVSRCYNQNTHKIYAPL